MDIAVLILVNLITAVIMYVLFSLRFSVAVEKAEKASRKTIVRELKQNIEQAIRLMDDSLDIIDRKMTTFYRLLRRAEELAEELDVKTKARTKAREKEKTQAKTKQKPIPASRQKQTSLKTEINENHPVGNGEEETLFHDDFFKTLPQENETSDRYMERLLDKVQGEKIEISSAGGSVDEIYEKGKMSPELTSNEAKKKSSSNTIEKLGGIVKKAFGIEKDAFGKPESGKIDSDRNPPSFEMKAQNSFSEILEDTEKKAEAKIQSESAFNQNSIQSKRELREDVYDESMLNAKDLSERYYNTHDHPSRQELVKYLLKHGCRISEIAKELNLSPAEIELIASLPLSTAKPRKEKIQKQSSESDDGRI